MEKYIKEYQYYLRGELNLSKNTCTSYLSDIKDYLNYIQNICHINNLKNINTDDIRKYLATLKKNGISSSSRTRKLTSIRSFYKFLLLEKYINQNIADLIDKPKVKKKMPVILSIEEVELLISSFKMDTPINIRNKTMIEISYSAGLRVSELINLQISDAHLDMGFLRVYGKGKKERIVPIGELAIDSIKLYLHKSRPFLLKKNNSYLFVNNRGEKLSRQSFYLILAKKAKQVGIKKNVHPHTLRHSFASHLLANGLDLRIIQELLGHEDISTTEIYTHVNNQKLKEIYLNAHPHAHRKE